ncbi:MAG: hypothetical protein JXB50_12015 [Spirochaetes bacterium]|nr:hypothetical protein [Spirochaetota bacterium]
MRIPKFPPRDHRLFKKLLHINKGLKGYYFYSIINLAVCILILLSAFFPPNDPGMVFFKIVAGVGIFGFTAFFSFNTAFKAYKERKDAFINGIRSNGKIVNHKRKFVLWKTSRDYCVIVEIPFGDKLFTKEIVSSNKKIFVDLPVRSTVEVLFNDKNITMLSPYELNVNFEYE